MGQLEELIHSGQQELLLIDEYIKNDIYTVMQTYNTPKDMQQQQQQQKEDKNLDNSSKLA